MPIQHGIFYESQSSHLCRLHALNGYFGKSKISPQQFIQYQKEYDDEYKKKFNFQTSCAAFDIVSSDQKNIVSFILKKHRVYTRYYSLNQLYGKNINDYIIKILEGDWFFIYNEYHIYGIRRKDNRWFRVDSMGGVRTININSVNQKNIGFIVPVNIKKEFYLNLVLMKNILGGGTVDDITADGITEYLIQKNKENSILGHLEIPLGICMDILETNLLQKNPRHNLSDFNPIQEQVENYQRFISQFTNGKYTDIVLILKYLPDIIFKLTRLKTRYN